MVEDALLCSACVQAIMYGRRYQNTPKCNHSEHIVLKCGPFSFLRGRAGKFCSARGSVHKPLPTFKNGTFVVKLSGLQKKLYFCSFKMMVLFTTFLAMKINVDLLFNTIATL